MRINFLNGKKNASHFFLALMPKSVSNYNYNTY